MLKFRVLGPVEASADSVPLELGGPKQRAVLALLLLRPNEFVSRERLIDEIWGDAPPATARETVKVYVSRLRRLLSTDAGPVPLATRGGGYLLAIDPEQVDLHRFDRLAECGSEALAAGDAEGAAALLRDALALWRGPPLADLADVAFAPAERSRLEELRLAALEERIDADLMLGHATAVVPELQQLTHEHPYRERLHRQLMLALYRSSRQADALHVYRSLRRRLASELGLEPSSDSRELERAVLAADAGLVPAPVEQRLGEGGGTDDPRPQLHRWLSRSWRVALLAVSVALLTVGVLTLRALFGGDERAAPSAAAPAGRIDGRIPVPLPGGPHVGKLAFGDGALWIRKGGDDEALRVNPRTGKIVAHIKVGFAYDHGIAIRGHDIWVTDGEEATVSRIDAASNEVVATVRVGEYPLGIAATTNAVWVANLHSGSVSRIDPRLNRVVKAVPISTPSHVAGPKAIAVAGATVWVADAYAGAVVRLDARRNRRVEAIAGTGPACGGMTAFGDSIWVASACDQSTVTRVDTRTARVTAEIQVPGTAADVAAGFGSIWVTTSRGILLRIDPKTNRVAAKLRLGDAAAVTTGGGFVWVVNRENRSVIRIRPAD